MMPTSYKPAPEDIDAIKKKQRGFFFCSWLFLIFDCCGTCALISDQQDPQDLLLTGCFLFFTPSLCNLGLCSLLCVRIRIQEEGEFK